jgi:hypothetical protein
MPVGPLHIPVDGHRIDLWPRSAGGGPRRFRRNFGLDLAVVLREVHAVPHRRPSAAASSPERPQLAAEQCSFAELLAPPVAALQPAACSPAIHDGAYRHQFPHGLKSRSPSMARRSASSRAPHSSRHANSPVFRPQSLQYVSENQCILMGRYCYPDKLNIAGNCRMCLVEMERSPKPSEFLRVKIQD